MCILFDFYLWFACLWFFRLHVKSSQPLSIMYSIVFGFLVESVQSLTRENQYFYELVQRVYMLWKGFATDTYYWLI